MSTKSEVEWVSVLRRSDGLFVYRIIRREPFAVVLPTSRRPADDLSTLDPYREEILPLASTAQANTPVFRSALKSWEALGKIDRLDATILAHLANVLLYSLPDESDGGKIQPLKLEPEVPVVRPTAANPRAYKGTKDQPPKRKKPVPMDLRPHLSIPRDLHELILRLAPFQSEAAEVLNKEDLQLPPLLDSLGRGQDLYITARHQVGGQSLCSLPGLF